MTLKERFRERLAAAVRARDEDAKNVLRVVLGDAEMRATGSDADIEKIARKVIQANAETVEKTQDETRRAKLVAENVVLTELLPKELTLDEILAMPLDAVIAGLGEGQAIGAANKYLKAQGHSFKGSDVAAAVKRKRAT